ncbi:Fic family protein [Friedmanniella luteola]|uniref:Fic family protein n=1 Tax=Friedmanniella luteola TaxID=546871 RepID=A0A1H1Q3Z0_9ACTN|nr:Fic family protein [Friedmanniella luteola]SDS18231.1 Fic family protein [Friedmanniella luteola]
MAFSDQGHRWPPVGHEQLIWDSRSSGAALSRTERQRAHGRYHAAVPPPIAELDYAVPVELAGPLEDAAAELARYDAEMATSPAPLDAVLLRSESAASSQIENLTASARSIGLAELGDASRSNASLVVANTQAMRCALDLAAELTPETVLAMHRALLGASEPDIAGAWRTEPVWIGRSSLSPVGADYVAPRAERIEPLVEDLMRYARRVDQPVLAQAALAYAQFETIHPFPDGNGRTGRALLHAMLRHHRLSRHVTVPVSAGLLSDVTGYHAALTAYRAGDPDPVVRLCVDATFRAITNGRALAVELAEIREGWRGAITARRDSAVWRAADLFLARPVLDAAQVAAALGIAVPNAHRHLERLVDAGVLTSFPLYRRARGWRADAVLRALDAFAARAGRRARP